MEQCKYTKTNGEEEEKEILTEYQGGVLRIDEYFSPAQQSKFNWLVLTVGSNMLLILGLCDFFFRFGRFDSGKVGFHQCVI